MHVYELEVEEITLTELEEEITVFSASSLYWALKNRSIIWVL